MKKDLIMYFPSDFGIEILPISPEQLMRYLDNCMLQRLINRAQEIDDLEEGEIYDRV